MEQVNYNSGEVLESLNNKLDRDFNNMAINSVNFAKYSNNVTNCITEIPQDIKLELNNGTLTLKAGSKVYIPNGKNTDGSLKFDVVTISSDLIAQTFSQSGTCFIRYESGILFCDWVISTFSSGSDSSTVTGWYYDTSKNEIKYYENGVAHYHTVGFPLGIATVSNGTVTTIDQVFNGFGYIGSTIFALPGVKGLIPNGRNEDGSLKNIEFTVDSVWLGQTAYNTNKATLGVVSDMKILSYVTDNDVIYDESDNKNKLVSSEDFWQGCFAGGVSVSDMKFTTFTPKTAFHAVDYNDLKEALKANGGGLEIGDIGFAPLGIDESQNKRRYLNGQVISQSQFGTFADKVKKAVALYPSLSATEENWQAEVTNSKLGQCGKFVIDDTAGTIRLPKVVNINGLTDLSLMGGIKAESLPNIKGAFGGNRISIQNEGWANGCFAVKNSTAEAAENITSTKGVQFDFDASLSSSTYQDNASVQQEAVQYPYFIQVATGTEESVDVSTEIQLNNPFSLLDYKWSEYELSNASWLLSNGTFHSGATYVSVYELLLKIYNGTETKDGVSVKLSTETYEDTDFVLNTADTTFRLPVKVKQKFLNAIDGDMPVVGNGIGIGITNGSSDCNITSSLDWNGSDAGSNALKPANKSFGVNVGSSASMDDYSRWGNQKIIGITTDPTKSGMIAKVSQSETSGLKLYFYVGETIQDANVINASGVLTDVANLKGNTINKSSASDRETVVGWGTPDYSAGIAVSTSFTAPSAGLVVYILGTTSSGGATVNGTEIVWKTIGSSYDYAALSQNFYCSKGDAITLPVGGIFYPLKGVN